MRLFAIIPLALFATSAVAQQLPPDALNTLGQDWQAYQIMQTHVMQDVVAASTELLAARKEIADLKAKLAPTPVPTPTSIPTQ